MAKTGVLLINLGTPDSPKVRDVRRYLTQFLNDPRVIDIPWLWRKLLVNFIIVPFRAPKSAKIYHNLWTENGSPLLYYGEQVKDKLQTHLGADYHVELAMRYQNPSIPSILDKMRKMNFEKLIIIPLYPQYASSSTGSTMEEVMHVIKSWWVVPEISIVSQFYDHPGFINAFTEIGKKYPHENYDHVIFSFHGLPERQVDKVYESGFCTDRDCKHEITQENQFCYKATSYATARMLAEKLNIPQEKYTVSFQSRLDDKWIKPYSDKVVEKMAKEGAKKLLIFSPAFVADCLETIIEIGDEYDEIFKEHGGESVQLVESLNDHPLWIDTLANIAKTR